MKISFTLSDDSGHEYQGTVDLLPVSKTARLRAPVRKAERAPRVDLAFNVNPRAFMKRYGRELSGPQKFTLLLARLAQGKSSIQVPLEQIAKHWNSMKCNAPR